MIRHINVFSPFMEYLPSLIKIRSEYFVFELILSVLIGLSSHLIFKQNASNV